MSETATIDWPSNTTVGSKCLLFFYYVDDQLLTLIERSTLLVRRSQFLAVVGICCRV